MIIILSSPEEAEISFRLMASDKQDRRDFGPSGLGPGRSGCVLLTDLFPEVAKIRTPARAAQRAKESTAGQRLGLALGPQEGPANWPTLPGTAVTGACRWHPFCAQHCSEHFTETTLRGRCHSHLPFTAEAIEAQRCGIASRGHTALREAPGLSSCFLTFTWADSSQPSWEAGTVITSILQPRRPRPDRSHGCPH